MQFAEISKNPLPLFSLFFSSGSTEALESEISQPQTCPFQAQVCLGSEDPHHQLPNPSCLHPRVQGCQGEMQCLAIPGNQKGVRRCVSLTTCLQAMPGGLAATRLSMQQVIKVPFCMLNFPAGDLGDPTRNLGAFAWMYLSPAIQQRQHNNIERVLNVAKFMCGFLILLLFVCFWFSRGSLRVEEVPITHYPFAGVVIGTVIQQRRPVFQLEFCFCRNHTAFFCCLFFLEGESLQVAIQRTPD